MARESETVPDHVPADWAARFGDTASSTRPNWSPADAQLAKGRREAHRDTWLLAIAASVCVLLLVVSLGWALAARASLFVVGGVVVVFGACLTLMHRIKRRSRRPTHGNDR